jgi:hypothetical protein
VNARGPPEPAEIVSFEESDIRLLEQWVNFTAYFNFFIFYSSIFLLLISVSS